MLIRYVLATAALASIASADNWPQWRGPSADGISTEKAVPVEWNEKQNVLWKAPLAGLGTSTPIVWDGKVFVTSQIGDGPFEQRGRDFADAVAAKKTGERQTIQFVIQAFNAADGRHLWEHKFDAEGQLQAVHMKHNLASPSIVTDGARVYAWVSTGQLKSLTLDGELVWSRNLAKDIGPFEILWGHGSSPVVYKESLILLCDHQGQAYLMAVDRKTGRTLWKVDRGKDRRSYTTPFVVRGPKGDELIVNSSERVDALDPATGELLWWTGQANRVPVPSPVFANGVIYVNRGYSSSPYLAVRPGGRGDVSKSHVVWEVKTGAPYVSSLLFYHGLIYMATETGIASCVDAADGKLLWRERLGGVFSASPVGANGKVYLVNENGETFVLNAGRQFQVLHKNVIEERTLASPAVSGGRLFLRTDDHLLAIGRRGS